MPCGSFLGAVGGGLGADGLAGVVVAVQLAVGADVGGAVLPVQAGQGVVGERVRARAGSRLGVLGEVLADAVLSGVHRGGELGEEPVQLRVRCGGYLLGPGAGRERHQRVGDLAEPEVDDGGDVPRAGQRPGCDGLPGLAWAGSSPAVSAARRVRQSQVAAGESSPSAAYPGGRASRTICW